MIFRRKRFPLPKFPPEVAPTFKRLCQRIDVEELPQLQSEIEATFRDIRANLDRLDERLIDALEQRCQLLLESYLQADSRQQAMILGALRYVALQDDPLDDAEFASGRDDDVMVVNHVLEALGLEDQAIELRA